jgi:hypothetical protein
MTTYSRKQVLELLKIDEGFLLSLEREEIIISDVETQATGEYSERMLERARVAHNLVRDLEVNLPGTAVILQMREEMSELRRHVESLVAELRRRESS